MTCCVTGHIKCRVLKLNEIHCTCHRDAFPLSVSSNLAPLNSTLPPLHFMMVLQLFLVNLIIDAQSLIGVSCSPYRMELKS